MFQKIQEITSVILGLRKFLIMAALISIAVVFRLHDYLDGAQFTDLLKATTLGFLASNSMEHLKMAVTSYADSKSGKQVQETDSSVGDDSNAK